MDNALSRGQRILASQPFSVLVGAELVSLRDGRAEIRVPVRDNLTQQHGFVHGGVIAYAADNAIAFAGGSAWGAPVVTAAVSISYLRPAKGDHIVARAAVAHHGKTQAVARCDVFAWNHDDGEVLCSVAQGTVARLP